MKAIIMRAAGGPEVLSRQALESRSTTGKLLLIP